MHRKMFAKERTTGRKTGTRVVKDTESKEERDRIKNAKRAQQQRIRRAKVLGLVLCLRLALGLCRKSMSWIMVLGTHLHLNPYSCYNTQPEGRVSERGRRNWF